MEEHDFPQMQAEYQRIKHTWREQDDATKGQMLIQLQQIHHCLLPGERGFMTDIREVERAIEVALQGDTA